MYLHEILVDERGIEYAMCGALRGKCFYTGGPVRFGYVIIAEREPIFMESGESIKGHEFHYFDSDNNGTGCIARKPVTGKAWDCVHEAENSFWGFPHLYYPSNPGFAAHFVQEARKFRQGRTGGEEMVRDFE